MEIDDSFFDDFSPTRHTCNFERDNCQCTEYKEPVVYPVQNTIATCDGLNESLEHQHSIHQAAAGASSYASVVAQYQAPASFKLEQQQHQRRVPAATDVDDNIEELREACKLLLGPYDLEQNPGLLDVMRCIVIKAKSASPSSVMTSSFPVMDDRLYPAGNQCELALACGNGDRCVAITNQGQQGNAVIMRLALGKCDCFRGGLETLYCAEKCICLSCCWYSALVTKFQAVLCQDCLASHVQKHQITRLPNIKYVVDFADSVMYNHRNAMDLLNCTYMCNFVNHLFFIEGVRMQKGSLVCHYMDFCWQVNTFCTQSKQQGVALTFTTLPEAITEEERKRFFEPMKAKFQIPIDTAAPGLLFVPSYPPMQKRYRNDDGAFSDVVLSREGGTAREEARYRLFLRFVEHVSQFVSKEESHAKIEDLLKLHKVWNADIESRQEQTRRKRGRDEEK